MRRNHHRARADGFWSAFELNPLCPQFLQHGFVVNEIAQNRQWLTLRSVSGKGDCIPHPKTHSQMFCSNDFHN